jgi:hypothetical protein
MVNQVPAVDTLLFTKTLEFAGVFRDGDLATKPLSVEILYSQLNAHAPIGVIRGTVADWPELETFFHERKLSLCELESVSAAEGRGKIHSGQVLLREISCRHPDDKSETIHQILGHFELLDITIDQNFGQRDTSNREMTFLLRGPTRIWMSDAIRMFSYLGSTRTEFPNACLPLPCVEDLRIAARPHFLYASALEAERLFALGKNRHCAPGTAPLSIEAEAFALTLTDCDLDVQTQILRRGRSKSLKLCAFWSRFSLRQTSLGTAGPFGPAADCAKPIVMFERYLRLESGGTTWCYTQKTSANS